MTPAKPGSAAASDEQEGEEGESTSLDLPGRPQDIAALDTLQHYLLGVSHSDRAQMSLLSVEQFIERMMHYATDYALFSCTAIETINMAKAYLYLYICIYMHSLFNELAWRFTYDYMV